MTNISTRLAEIFRNLKSDAVPRAPRQAPEVNIDDVTEENNDNDSANEPEEIVIELDDMKKKKDKAKSKKSKKRDSSKLGQDKPQKENGGNRVNVQATGNVINIVDSKNVHWGNVFINQFGSNGNNKSTYEPEEETIQKCNLITLLMEAEIKPDHEYIDYVAKNLGKNWYTFFRTLGYTKGRIETVEIDEARNGVSEARYKLLLDWVRNDNDGTLGRLATLLWEEGEREIVKELALIYKKNKN